MENMIIARFKDNETAAETDKLRQWDYGQTLRIEGLSLPDVIEVHFSIRDIGGDAERQIGTTKDGVTEVTIPDKMLENKHCKCSEYTIYAWVYLSDETSGQTEYDIRIPVEARSKPMGFAPSNQPDFAGKVMEKLNDVETLKADFSNLAPVGAAVGQLFRVAAISEDGKYTMEPVDMPECDVTDVQIDGTSIVGENGVASLPLANMYKKFGIVRLAENLGVKWSDANGGGLSIDFANPSTISSRGSSNKPIVPYYLDYAVKCAMCDGKGAAWTEDEQAMARARMGVKDVFIAQRGVTKFAEIEEAYNSGKQVTCTDGWLVARLDILSPGSYAQFSGLDDLGNPALLKVTKDNTWTRTNVSKATTDYLDSEINKVNAAIAKQKTFIAEYGTTTYEELQNAYTAKKQLVLHIPANTLDGAPELYANLTSYHNNRFDFVCLYYNNIRYYFYAYRNSSNNTIWEHNESTLAEYAYVSIIDKNLVSINNNEMRDARDISSIKQTMSSHATSISNHTTGISENRALIDDLASATDNIGKYISEKDSLLSGLSNMNTVDILKSVYSFRGGFRDNAGTLHIKKPGIYLVLQGGTGNKQIIINQNGNEVLNETWNGIIILAYGSGVITPIGIETSLTIAGTFKMPGTYQGWTPDGSCSTTINYPSMCVVSYLGNSNVNYLE